MAEYRLSLQAESDLLSIYEYTLGRFGEYQAEAYHAGLEHSFALIADFPRIGVGADELVAGFRRFRFQSHNIFYTDEQDHVFIRALFHERMRLRRDLFE
ncbi:type II toxin-antitoxin system RelE/ParE family toxin [Rhizobium sp.]